MPLHVSWFAHYIVACTLHLVPPFSCCVQRAALSSARQAAPVVLGVGVVGSIAYASDDHIPPPEQSWWHQKFLGAHDSAGVRRGFQAYTQVCATCHRCVVRAIFFCDVHVAASLPPKNSTGVVRPLSHTPLVACCHLSVPLHDTPHPRYMTLSV